MKKSIAMKWVEALRSGKYKQGTGELHNKKENTYCCLGVLCAINGIIINEDNSSLIDRIDDREVLGIHTSNGTFLGDDGMFNTSLDSLNDSGNYTFDEIADIIQTIYKEL